MLKKATIENIISAALSKGGDFAEVYIEEKYNRGIGLTGGLIEKSMSGKDFGVGIRIFNGLNSIYVYSNSSDELELIDLAKEASLGILKNKKGALSPLKEKKVKNVHNIKIYPETVSAFEKTDLVKSAYKWAKNYDSSISQVKVNYLDYDKKILIANSEGLFKKDRRVRTRLYVTSIASNESEMQTGSANIGGHIGFEIYNKKNVREMSCEASRVAKTMLYADKCPSGKMDVVIDNGFGGVIFHEACGHGLEATAVAKGNSVFCDKVGKQVASPLVTAIDDGTLENQWGSLSIDDEGNKTQKNVLIENGILKGYLVDKLNGKRMNMKATGSSRRQNYKYAPTSRMTNTYIANGDSTFDEIISNTKDGLYAKRMGGGSVNPMTGEFNFNVMEGYIIKNGIIQKPVRGASLIGKGIEVLKNIDMVGNNLAFGQGMCGSVSGSIPVNVGQPTLRVKSITVGGVKED